jgi:prepilin signal peptidase PulO-like enzyme (type II secretory pathway)
VPFLPILFSGFFVNLVFGDMLYNLIIKSIFNI